MNYFKYRLHLHICKFVMKYNISQIYFNPNKIILISNKKEKLGHDICGL